MIRYVNHAGKFMRKLTENQRLVLEEIGQFCKNNMDKYVPVDTGFLKSNNNFTIQNNELALYNNCEYAKYVEYGTYKMKAQPFMKPAIYNHLGEIKMMAARGFGRGTK